jgi:hypothetical protein
MTEQNREVTPAMRRAELVLREHGIPDENRSYRLGERPKAKINAIIRDIQKANAEAEDDD